MDGLLDRASPRRGSLTSLHRQSSGSFTHSSKLASSASSAQQHQQQQSNKSPLNLCKEMDKFTRYFIIKAVQVIVQSRLDNNNKVKTECKSTGNDWFNINITDLPEITDRTKAALDSEVISVKTNWRFCCEISLRTNDGARVVLEHWIISNRAKSSSIQKLNSGLTSPKIYHSNRSSSSSYTNSSQHITSAALTSTNANINNGVVGHLNSGNGINTSGITRSRNATISCTRTKLNSIDDCSCDDVKSSSNNENNEPMKPSASCFTLSSASVNNNQTTDHVTAASMTSPSTNSLTNNNGVTQEQSSHQTNTNGNTNTSSQQQQGTRTSAMSSIYSIYNRMSLLLKTLMTTTHIVPACKLSLKTPHSDSCTICYRVYTTTSASSFRNTIAGGPRGSVEDMSCHSNSGSPNRRSSSSNSSFASVNIREFVVPDDLEHFCPLIKIGSIKTEINELEICLSYRTDMMTSCNLLKSQRKGMYSRILDEDCITAAKQLLAGNEVLARRSDSIGLVEKDSDKNDVLNLIDQPLKPAFAIIETQKVDKSLSAQQQQQSNLKPETETILETAFDNLLTRAQSNNDLVDETETDIKIAAAEYENNCEIGERSTKTRSEPIQVPEVSSHHHHHHNQHHHQHHSKAVGSNPSNHSTSQGSTPRSLTDSFVFIDLNPPFASEEQNDLNSFFHGPSPTFCNGFDSLKDVDELTNQLAVIEANAEQIDDFVDNICASEDEENDENENAQVD